MRLTEERLKEIIRQEVEYRLIESILDDLIVEELKKMGINEGEWEDEKRQLTRRKILQMLGGAAAVGATGAWIDSLVKADAAERRASRPGHAIADAQAAAKESLGEYEGPEFAEQQDYFSNLDFTGAIKDTNSLPEDSIGAVISQFRVQGLPSLYISTEALLDKPIPKIKANSGKAALEYYRIKYEAQQDKLRALLRLYKELVGIGQLGYAGGSGATIVVKAGGQQVRVLPPEWTILFHFITQEASELSEEELLEFRDQISSAEIKRYYNTIDAGKRKAINWGHKMGLRANKSGRTDITPEQYREEYPQDASEAANAAHHGAHFFDIGFAAGVAGEEEAPPVPR